MLAEAIALHESRRSRINIRVIVPIIAALVIGVIVTGVSCRSGELDETQSKIVALEADLAAAETEVSTLKAQVSTLEAGLAAAEAGVSALETELAAAEARISALEAELAATQSADGVEVEILDFGFNPQAITVPVGTTITWPNLDPVEHTVTSDTLVFDSSLAFNETFSYTFTEPGTYPYHCTIHDFMFGRIIVE